MATHTHLCLWWLSHGDPTSLVDHACLCRRGSDYQLPSTSAADTCRRETESNTKLGLSLQVSALPSRDVHTFQRQQSSTNTAGKSQFQPMCPWQCSGFFQVLDPFLHSFAFQHMTVDGVRCISKTIVKQMLRKLSKWQLQWQHAPQQCTKCTSNIACIFKLKVLFH